MLRAVIDEHPPEAFFAKSVERGKLKPDQVKAILDFAEGLKIEADLSAVSFRSDDGREGTTAFVEKRLAKFQDK